MNIKKFAIIATLIVIFAAVQGTALADKYIVMYAHRPTRADMMMLKRCGGRVKRVFHLINAVVVDVPKGMVGRIRKMKDVLYVEPDYKVYAYGYDGYTDRIPWNIKDIKADLVWNYTMGVGVNVCILDTGIDYTHPDLAPLYKGGYNFVDNNSNPLDDNGHGTHCAGIVAAALNNFGLVGVAPKVNLYAVKVLNASGVGTIDEVVAGIEWAIEHHMDIISMSFGTTQYSQTLEQICDLAYKKGILLVAAAGNNGDGNINTTEISYPAAYSSVIAVGAVNRSNVLAYFSNTGNYIELVAPGVDINSTLPTYGSQFGSYYGILSGTSMACPHVTGVAALLKSFGLNNTEIRHILDVTADDLGPPGKDPGYGYGLVDALRAVEYALNLTSRVAVMPISPKNGSYINTSHVRIVAKLLNANGAYMYLNGNKVNATFNGTYIYYYANLSDGNYTVTVYAWNNKSSVNATWYFVVDTTPPAKVTGLKAIAVSPFEIVLTWNPVSGAVKYKVYRKINGTFTVIATVNTTYYADKNLKPNTTYYYYVTAVDRAGNEGPPSDIVSNTTLPLLNLMIVKWVKVTVYGWGRWWRFAVAIVKVVNETGYPVSGAEVYGHWKGIVYGKEWGYTDSNGIAVFYSPVVRAYPGATFTFVVDNVVKSGWTFDRNDSVTSGTAYNYY